MKIDLSLSWYLYEVTLEWLLKDKGETYQPWTTNVASTTAEAAIEAAKRELSRDKDFKSVRLVAVKPLLGIDVFARLAGK